MPSVSPAIRSETLVISDVDDTLKNSHTGHPIKKLTHMLNTSDVVPEMPSVMNSIVDYFSADIAYVTAAPKFVMECSHLEFLEQNDFPEGPVFFREKFEKKYSYKLKKITEQIQSFKPSHLILIGDNRSADESVYLAIADMFVNLEVQIFIRDVRRIEDGQIGPYQKEIHYFTDGNEVKNKLGIVDHRTACQMAF